MTTWNIRGDKTDNYLDTDNIVVEFSEHKDKDAKTKTQKLDWLNWVSLSVDEKSDAIRLHLSTGDTRGSQFSMSLTRPEILAKQTKCLLFDVKKDHSRSLIYSTKIYGKLLHGGRFD